MTRRPAPLLAACAATACAATVLGGPAAAAPAGPLLAPVATYAVEGEVAEILAATPDGRTVLHTDSETGQVGLVDVSDAARPRSLGAVEVGGEPTSVAVVRRGALALVTVDTTDGDHARPSGHLAVVDLVQRTVRTRVPLGGQPDSVDVSPDGAVAAVAIENQRDEDLEVGGVEGGLPQAPAGHLAVVRLDGPPERWGAQRVGLTGLRGARYPGDPEPEYVDVDARHRAVVTLQENNAVAVVDLDRLRVTASFSAGVVRRGDADVVDDGVVAFDDRLVAPREPDAVRWTAGGNLVTADEGDLAAEPSGGRGWSVFSPAGALLWTSGSSAERALARAGRYDDDRSDDKGAEIEGAAVTAFAGRPYAVVGSERADAVLVYDLARERSPRLVQVLATGSEPEGILALPRRGLLLTGNEGDGTISVFRVRR